MAEKRIRRVVRWALRPQAAAPILALILFLAMVVSAGWTAAPIHPAVAQADEAAVLTVTGPTGTQVQLTMTQFQALTAYEGFAGFKNSAGNIFGPDPIKGVSIGDLATLVGGIGPTDGVTVLGTDNYGMTYTHDQAVNGAWTAYDPATGDQVTPTQPFTMVVGYGQGAGYPPIPGPPSGDGPLRIFIAQPSSGQVVDGHLLVKWVGSIQIGQQLPDWKVRMYGLWRKNHTRQTYTLDRESFLSCAAPGCHGASYKDAKGRVWSGVPFFLCIGKVDGGKGHGGYGAFNEALALRGYRIKVSNAVGHSVIIKSRFIVNKERLILANKLDGKELTSYPLKLVGPKLSGSQWIGRITRIQLLPRL